MRLNQSYKASGKAKLPGFLSNPLVILFFILSVSIAGIASIGISQNATAVDPPTPIPVHPLDEAKSYVYYYALANCIQEQQLMDDRFWLIPLNDHQALYEDHAKAGQWFVNDYANPLQYTEPPIGYFLDGLNVPGQTKNDQGRVGCSGTNGGAWITNAASTWGYNETGGGGTLGMLCDIGAIRDNGSDCVIGSGQFGGNDGFQKKLSLNQFYQVVSLHVTKVANKKPVLSEAGQYILMRRAFFSGCLNNPNPSVTTKSESDPYTYIIKYVEEDGTVSLKKYYGTKKNTDEIRYYTNDALDDGWATCGELAGRLQNGTFADSYKTVILARIAAGASEESVAGGESEGDATKCAISGGLGWLICPAINFMSGIVDASYGIVGGLLSTPTVKTVDESGNQTGTYQAWQIMRTFANVAFVIVFLIIIFSQVTGAGVTNYGIKKLLPKLIIAAILVNLSYIICTVAVDASNILGSSIKALFDSIGAQISSPTMPGVADTGNAWTGLATLILAGGIVFGLAVFGLLSIFLPSLIAAVLAIVIVFLTLTIRQALVIMLIIISPLAFVAYLLPGTEKLFEKWRKLMTTLLLMFPIIAGIFGAAAIASKVVMNSSDNTYVQIMGALMAIIPLAITPIVMKTASGALGTIGAKLQGMGKKPQDFLNKGAGNIAARERASADNKIMNNPNSKNPFALGRRLAMQRKARLESIKGMQESEKTRALNQYTANATENDAMSIPQRIIESIAPGAGVGLAGQMAAGGSAGAAGRARVKAMSQLESLNTEELKVAMQLLAPQLEAVRANGGNTDDFLMQIARDRSRSILERNAAVNQLGALGRDAQIRELRDDPANTVEEKTMIQKAITSNVGSLMAKAPDMVKNNAAAAFKNIKGKDLSSITPATAKAYVTYVQELHVKATAVGHTAADIDNLNDAVNSFNSSVTDIANTPALQADFGGDTGRMLVDTMNTVAAADPTFHTLMTTVLAPGLGSIQPDGKIR